MSYAQYEMLVNSRYFKYDQEIEEDKKNDEKINGDLFLLCSILVISVSLLVIYSITTRSFKSKIGYSHLVLFFWTSIQILPVIVIYNI